MSRIRCTITVLAVFGALRGVDASQARFVESELVFDVPIESRLSLPALGDHSGAIVLLGRTEDRSKVLSVHFIAGNGEVSSIPSIRLELSQDVLFFDTAVIGDEQTLAFLTPFDVQVLDLDTGALERLMTIQSVYRNPSTAPLTRLDFMVDVNADGREDVVIQDFAGLQVALQQEQGFEPAIVLDVPPTLTVSSNESRYRTDQIYLYDFDLDESRDIAVVRNNEFLVFESDGNGSFAAEAIRVPIELDLASDEEVARFEQNLIDVDQSDFRFTRISQITDLDSDELPDIVTFTAISSGVFEKRSEYHVYLASHDGRGVRYSPEADAEILSNGFQISLSTVDADNDSYQDIVSASVNFGFRQLIAALFTRSVGLDVALHRFRPESAYAGEPDFETTIRLKFNISNGFISNPAVRFGDFNADGRADLLLQHGTESFEIRPGSGSGSGFDGEPWSWETSLPLDGTLIELADADGDDRQDILIGYGRGDGDDLRSRMRVLISRL